MTWYRSEGTSVDERPDPAKLRWWEWLIVLAFAAVVVGVVLYE